MRCKQCHMSHRNSIHHQKTQFRYHAFIEMPPDPEPTTPQELLETVRRLKAKLDGCNCDNPGSHAKCLANFADEVEYVLNTK
jgi:hypothetical protein